jgi:pyrimidine-nucleoside phosphorylase
MNFLEIIKKKKKGKEITKKELLFVVDCIEKSIIKDYQLSALLMVIHLKGLSKKEVINFVEVLILKDEKNAREINNIIEKEKRRKGSIFIDKHSSGGIADSVTLLFSPIIASFGIKIIKIAGRSLDITGGTIDKLNSIPNFKTDLNKKEIEEILNENNICILSQTTNFASIDKKIYEIRDVTATFDDINLIAISIMCKKLLFKTDLVLLDIKCGKGAAFKNIKDAKKLAILCKKIADSFKRKIIIFITDMNQPLGKNIGNALEIKEIFETLEELPNNELLNLTIEMVISVLLKLNLISSNQEGKEKINKKLKSKEVLIIFQKFIEIQKGKWEKFKKYDQNFNCQKKIKIKSKMNGFFHYQDIKFLGQLLIEINGGRKKQEDEIDYKTGISCHFKNNQIVKVNDDLFTIYINKENANINLINKSFLILKKAKKKENLIKFKLTK